MIPLSRLPLAALLLCAALAVLAVILARPRWRWEEPLDDEQWDAIEAAVEPRIHFTFPDGTTGPGDWNPVTGQVEPHRTFASGRSRSMTSRADNAVLSSVDDAARWAGG